MCTMYIQQRIFIRANTTNSHTLHNRPKNIRIKCLFLDSFFLCKVGPSDWQIAEKINLALLLKFSVDVPD